MEESLFSAANDVFSDVPTLQQDNALIHSAANTKNWPDDNDVHVLEWPVVFSDPNIIENVWMLRYRLVNEDGAI